MKTVLLTRLQPLWRTWAVRWARYSLLFFIMKGLVWSLILLYPLFESW